MSASVLDRPLAERIDDAYRSLSPQEARVADFLRARPEESALYNSSELARLTGVSKATVSRLYRRLGFAGSHEVRDLLRTQRSAGVPVAVDTQDDALDAQLRRDIENLQRLYAGLSAGVIDDIAAALATADRVTIVGFRSGFPLALHLKQQLAQVRDDVRLVPEPGQSVAEELVGLTPGDVVIVIGIRRRPAGFAGVLHALAASPARIVVLADPTLRGRPDGIEWVLETPLESASPFDSLAPAMSIISLLAGAVLEAAGPAGAARVADIDQLYARLGELDAR